MTEIGAFLGRAREKAGLTQAEVAKLRQTSRGSQSQLEVASANPQWSTIETFAQAIAARVTLRFDLFNGESVEMIAGQIAPNLMSALYAERERGESNAHFDSRIATKIAEAVEPGKWARQNVLRVLVSAAIGENPGGTASFDFELDYGHWEDADGNWDLDGPNYVQDPISALDQNRVTFRRLVEGVVSLVRRSEDEVTRKYLPITSTPAFVAYVDEGAPDAQGAADQMAAIAADPGETDRLLAAIGFLPTDPRDKVPERHGA